MYMLPMIRGLNIITILTPWNIHSFFLRC